ncbi:MAG: Uma2 family endonuclease [Cyanobacteria bacterium P01_G01_bin.39]
MDLLTIGTQRSDRITMINDISWSEYEKILQQVDNDFPGRISYLDGTLAIMSSDRSHEMPKKLIGMLLEEYLCQFDLDFYALGSETFKKPPAGKEPDQSYCFGTKKDYPDLAIEIVVSSEGINDLAIYAILNVPEVWFYQSNKINIYSLIDDNHQLVESSLILSQLNIAFIEKYMLRTDSFNRIIRDFRHELNLEQ